MKKCPHCGQSFNFLQFVSGYGSDTLFKHPVSAHSQEHLCLHCHKMVWLRYDPVFFAQRFRQSLMLHLIFSAVLTFLGVKPALDFNYTQAGLFMILAMVFGGIIIMAFARYESVELRPEKGGHV